jgi:site-specific recombinase XerD
MKRWDRLVEGYEAINEQRGLASTSISSIRQELERCGCWLKRRKPKPQLEEVDGQLLIKYLKARTPFKARSTLASIASKLRCFGEYLMAQGVWQQNPMRWVRGPRLDRRGRMPRSIGAEHLRKLWDAAAGQRGEYRAQLLVAALALLYGTGLRRGELERLNLQDWKREQSLLTIDGRKTGRERNVPVTDAIARTLEAYLPLRQNLLEAREDRTQTALLLNHKGQRLKGTSLSIMIHRLARKAQIPLVTLHQFRHTCASDLLAHGASAVQVQNLLGHQTLATTARYLHVADPQRAEAIRKHPLNDYLKEVLAQKETAI